MIPRIYRALIVGCSLVAMYSSPLGAITITEIMYHPGEATPGPYEYIEIYNEHPDPFDLGGYSICDGVDFTFPEGTILDGKSFLVVCADRAAIQAKYGIANTVGNWGSPAEPDSLSNAGEEIEICNAAGISVLQVDYNDRGKWPGGADGTGHSIELIAPYLDGDDPDNWMLSNDLDGSPGVANPCWDADLSTGPSGGGPVGQFNDHLDVGSPCSPGNTTFATSSQRYTITGSGNDIWSGGDQFQFAYVQINGNFDVRARIVSRAWGPSRWGKGGLMVRQDLSVSSRYAFVHDNPDPDGARMATRATHGGNDNAEPFLLADGVHPNWYRLNRSGNTITGYHSTNGTSWTEFGTFTWAGGAITHVGLALTSHSNCDAATLVWDDLTLTGNIIPPDDPGGGEPPEPGECSPRVPVVINEALIRTAGSRWVELYNKGSSTVNLGGYHLTDDRNNLTKTQLAGGTSIAAGGYLSFTDTELGLDFSVNLPGDRVFVALVEPGGGRVVDAFAFEPQFDNMSEARVPDGDTEFDSAADPTRGLANSLTVNTDVVINEVMYHPIENDRDHEWVEFYNRGASAVDLTGWRISRGVNYSFEPGTTIPAGGYIVVARNPDLIRAIHGLGSEVVGPQTPEALDAFGTLRDRGERITLKDGFGRTVDTVRVRDGGEFARWADGHGSSLELIDPFQDNRPGQSWDASDDSAKAPIETFSYIGRHGGGESELHLLLASRGITIVDDVSVVGGGVQTNDTPLVDDDETWRYFKGTTAPPSTWNDPGFNDGGWDSGQTGIGYSTDHPYRTVLDDMEGNYLTVFCRRTFNVSNVNAIDELVLSIIVDDGFVAYINGTQVASHNVSGTAFDSTAINASGNGDLVERDISSFKNLLQNGSNTLAISVHNVSLGSSDLTFIPRLLNRTTTIVGGSEQVVNPHFNSNTSGWIIEGTHIRSGRTTVGALNGAGSLKIVASGRGDNKVNRIETSNSGINTLNTGEDLQISFKARWVIGSQTIITHGYEHAMAQAHALAVPENLGTPGGINSVTQRLINRTGSSNLGPVMTDLEQVPAVPTGGEAVTIRARVVDSDGVASVQLRYSLNNPSSTGTPIAMTHRGGGVYEATIPGQSTGTKVMFFITATDGGGRPGRYPVDVSERTHPLALNAANPPLDDQRFFIYRHDTQNPGTNFENYRFWMSDSNQSELTSRRRLSNDLVAGSFVFGSSTIYHESKARFSGSPWARGGSGGSWRVAMPRDNPLFETIRKFNMEDHHGNGADARERLSHYLLRHNQGQIRVPYSDSQWMVRWQVNSLTTATREHVWVPDVQFLALWYPDDDDGDFLEMDDRFVINDNGDRTGSTDGRVLYPPPSSRSDGNGDNKENYRWFFGLRAKNGADDFSNFIEFARLMDPGATPTSRYRDEVWDHVDVEEMLRIWAVRSNTDDWDTWGTNRGKNCYFYRTENDGLWKLFAWDMELTYGNVDSFLIPSSPTSDYNMGGFAEVNRMFDVPKIKRMYYAILDEMVNGSNRWFHSSHLSTYWSRLQGFGLANTGHALAGGFIDQRASRLQTRIEAALYPRVRLQITTNSGNNFSSNTQPISLAGTAPAEACIFAVSRGPDPIETDPPDFSSMSAWTLDNIPLGPGANELTIIGFDLRGNFVDSDSITVTFTGVPLDPPVITALNPSTAFEGDTIDIIGSDFLNGVRVFFGGAESPSVSYDRNGPTPDTIVAEVPAGSGSVQVSVRNVDGQNSNGMTFTYDVLPAPMITSLNPSSAFIGDDVEINGTDFRSGARVFFGANESVSTSVTPTRIVARAPIGTGAVQVRVRNPDGQNSNGATFTYGTLPPPEIDSLNPSSALPGADIEIIGSNFRNGLDVFFGGRESTVVVYDRHGPTPNTIIARVPNEEGTVPLTVVNVDGQISNEVTFTYLEPPPDFLRGDVNGDGWVDLPDAVRILLGLFAGRPLDCDDAADTDDNEVLNVTDAVIILEFLFDRGPPPRFPYPGIGQDPSGTVLGCVR